MTTEEELKSCEACGASIYPEHLESGRAGYWKSQLLCPVCMNEKKSETATAPAMEAKDQTADDEPVAVEEEEQKPAEEEEPLALVEEEELEKSHHKIQAFSGTGLAGQKFDEHNLKRGVNKSGTGATRLKIFHTKMNDGAVNFMTQTINEWIDANPEVEIKICETTVGVWEGKKPEPHLICLLWY